MENYEDEYLDKDYGFVKRLLAVIIFICAMAVILCSCVTAKKCAARYPPNIYDSTRIEMVMGDTQYLYDTVTADCDSLLFEWAIRNGMAQAALQALDKRVGKIRVPCPPSTHRVDTVKTDRLRQIERTDKLVAMQKQLDKKTWWVKWLTRISLVLGVWALLRLVGKIVGGKFGGLLSRIL